MAVYLYKGASLVSVRQALQKKQLEERFVAQLSADERDQYQRVMATDWVPVTLAERVYATAAPLLYPGQPSPVRLLGRDLARDHLRGIYRFMLRLATVHFVVEQTARLWRMYNSDGHLRVIRSDERSLDFVLEQYPAYPAVVRESLAGYIVGTVELTGAENVRIVHLDSDPTRYEFRVTWRPLRGLIAAHAFAWSGLLLAFGSARCGRCVGCGANGEHLEPGPVPAAGGSRKNPAQRAGLLLGFASARCGRRVRCGANGEHGWAGAGSRRRREPQETRAAGEHVRAQARPRTAWAARIPRSGRSQRRARSGRGPTRPTGWAARTTRSVQETRAAGQECWCGSLAWMARHISVLSLRD